MKKMLVIMVSVLVLVGCKKPKEETSAEPDRIVSTPVATEILTSTDFDNWLEVTGRVDPLEEAIVASESPGRALKAPFEENQKVSKGDLLLRVDAVRTASQISLLKSAVESAKREYERTKQLASEGLATPQQVDQLASQVDQADLNMRQAQVNLSKTVLRSPIDGFVVKKMVEEGEFVNAGAPVAKIIDYDTVKVIASVPEGDIGYVKEGEEVEVEIPAMRKRYKGLIYRRAIMANDLSRTFDVEIRIDNQTHELLPGMRAKVFLPRDVLKNVIVVQQDYILQGFDHQEAMVYEPDPSSDGKLGRAKKRIVKTGPTRGPNVVILEGLKAGDIMITRGTRGVVDGARVEVYNRKTRDQKLEESGSETANSTNDGNQ